MNALIVDTETTDLIANSAMPVHKQPRVLEFCGVLINEVGCIIDELDFMCNPGIPIPPDAARINGISDADVADKPQFCSFLPQLTKIFKSSQAIVAHNLSYDWSIINFELLRSNGRCDKLELQEAMFAFHSIPVKICTVEETIHFKGHRLSLTALHEHLFGEGFPAAHRARNDVNALMRCYVELIRRGDL